ncbi:PucR family transcriptional regulator [Mycetocola spongiae]|uniref:PucR family transcriptional regulator n=1 Tax=Mycetocola spongiae TaxID=2859226 RepID=UPI001CF4F326|nr:helix-turn-helix domain-containing protein [Mycetocola spongiae]UCR88790.1 helix-turn-helix domain-containing protein [Mycetocola spongiae]
MAESTGGAAVTLAGVLRTVGQPLIRLVAPASTGHIPLASVAVVEAQELRSASLPGADALLVIGARESDLPALLPLVRPGTVVFMKLAEHADPAADPAIMALIRRRRLALVRVHPDAGWDQLTGILQRLLAENEGTRAESAERGDLFALAENIAAQVRGLVTIEDLGGDVLAYSRVTAGADELRISSILGRRGPADQMRRLSDEGVLSALAREGGVLRVPAAPELRREARLAAGIFHDGEHLGNLWVQRGSEEFSADAETLVPGAARLAAEIMRGRVAVAPREDRLVLLGLGLGAPGEAPSITESYALAAQVNPRAGEMLAVVGFEWLPPGAAPGEDDPGEILTEIARYLRLHAASFRRPLPLARHGRRLYGVLATAAIPHLERWASVAIEDSRGRFGPGLRAGLAEAPEDIPTLPAARISVDHLLDTLRSDSRRPDPRHPSVVTLAGLRSEVLLGEIIDLVAAKPALRDPRLHLLHKHDAGGDGALVPTLRAYLDAFSDVRTAASALGIHPNTLRYRLGRIADISGLDLGDPATRVMLAVLLRVEG